MNHRSLSPKAARHLAAHLIQLTFATREPAPGDTDPTARQIRSALQQARSVNHLKHIGTFPTTRSALTTTDIPEAEEYAAELSVLVGEFGQARRFARLVPLGRNSKVPKLSTVPEIEYVEGSATLGELVPQMEWVPLVPKKGMGLVRVPSEIPLDNLEVWGQFFGEYAAAAVAFLEDDTFFNADGSATYLTQVGCLKAALNNGKSLTLSTGKTRPADITLANLRTLRSRVGAKVLNSRGCGYFMHRSHDELLSSLNDGTDCYKQTPEGPMLDGYPIHWIDVLPVYNNTAAASQLQILFGDPRFQALGLHRGLTLGVSDEQLFATDEMLYRVGERLVTANLNAEAMAVLQLAAA